MMAQFGIIGGGSWATALAKILTDNKRPLNWWVRSENIVQHITTKRHNPHYLRSVNFDTTLLNKLSVSVTDIVSASDCIIIAVPSAYVMDCLKALPAGALAGRQVVSAVKGLLPERNLLLNEWLQERFAIPLSDYFTIMGPCHAEEVASEKLSYLTFSGADEQRAAEIAGCFRNDYINTVTNDDVYGVQFAAVLKNIYALGAGIAHGLDYGDNFLSVLIANCADEMAGFLRKTGVPHIEVGIHEGENPVSHKKIANYAASVYLGDLLVTCYSPYSRNRSFGNMIGKGYSVKTAQLEMNMVAEGYNASKSIYLINRDVGAEMPIAGTIYEILWEGRNAANGFAFIEENLI